MSVSIGASIVCGKAGGLYIVGARLGVAGALTAMGFIFVESALPLLSAHF